MSKLPFLICPIVYIDFLECAKTLLDLDPVVQKKNINLKVKWIRSLKIHDCILLNKPVT